MHSKLHNADGAPCHPNSILHTHDTHTQTQTSPIESLESTDQQPKQQHIQTFKHTLCHRKVTSPKIKQKNKQNQNS